MMLPAAPCLFQTQSPVQLCKIFQAVGPRIILKEDYESKWSMLIFNGLDKLSSRRKPDPLISVLNVLIMSGTITSISVIEIRAVAIR